MEFKIFCSIAL